MPVSRMRMRPWLELQIDSNQIPGLMWLNKEKKIFQIPWKHAARHGWELEKDACLFQNWAVHTGRYKPGESEPDPKTWKANFRCAMNSLPDIEEVKSKSVNKGSSAIRVYRMLPPTQRSQKKEKKVKACKDTNTKNKRKVSCKMEPVECCSIPDDHNNYTASQDYSTQEMEVDSTVNSIDYHNNNLPQIPSIQSSINEWGNTVEITTADSTNEMYTFQVSPGPLPCNDENEVEDGTNLHEIADMLQQETPQWQPSQIEGRGYYISEICPSVDSSSEEDTDLLEMAGEVEFRFNTDIKIDLVSWLDPIASPSWSNLASTIAC